MVRRIVAMLMLVVMGAVACGGLDYFHRRQHERQFAVWLAALEKASGGKPGESSPVPLPAGRDLDCLLCVILHAPMTGQTPPILVAGLLLLSVARRLPTRTFNWSCLLLAIDCRGPPIL
jgi:hypothetical protein